MRIFTLKGLFVTAVFMLLGCLAIHADDGDLITKQITIKLEKAGTLPSKIGDIKKKITNLKIMGEINGTDLNFIDNMAGRYDWGRLATLDLSEAKIVEGGDYYYRGYYFGDFFCYTSDDVIGDYAFSGCRSLTNLTLPSSVTEIDYKAFEGCSGLTSLTLPSSVTEIGDYAFLGCSGLTSLSFPSGITSIGYNAFSGCSGLTSIYVYAEKLPKMESDVFDGCDAKKCTVYVPKGTYDDYWLSEFGYFENIVEFDPTGINNVITSNDAKELSRYSVNGQRLSAPTKGLNIVKYSDGSVKKVAVQ